MFIPVSFSDGLIFSILHSYLAIPDILSPAGTLIPNPYTPVSVSIPYSTGSPTSGATLSLCTSSELLR